MVENIIRRKGPGDQCEMCGGTLTLSFIDEIREYRCNDCNHFFAASSNWSSSPRWNGAPSRYRLKRLRLEGWALARTTVGLCRGMT
eukprot:g53498.t1